MEYEDGSWCQEDLKKLKLLSERHVTKVVLLRHVKNILVYGAAAYLITFLAKGSGTVGTIVSWMAIVAYGSFAMGPLMGSLMTAVSLSAPAPGKNWKVLQILVSVGAAAIYAAYALFIYAEME